MYLHDLFAIIHYFLVKYQPSQYVSYQVFLWGHYILQHEKCFGADILPFSFFFSVKRHSARRILCSFIFQLAVTLFHSTNTSNTAFCNPYNVGTKQLGVVP